MTTEQFCELHEQLEHQLAARGITLEEYLARARELRERLLAELRKSACQ